MRALIFEAAHRGHHLTYVRHLVPELLELGVDVVLVTSKTAAASTEYGQLIEPLLTGTQPSQLGSNRFTVDADFDYAPRTNWQSTASRIRALRERLRRYQPDFAYLPTADGISQALGVGRWMGQGLKQGKCRLEAVVHNTRFAVPGRGLADSLSSRMRLRATAMAPWDRWYVVDCRAYQFLKDHCPGAARKCHLLPDPVELLPALSTSEARQRLELPCDGRYVGFCGLINASKGFDRMIEAFDQAQLEPTDRILFAGRIDQEMQSWLDKNAQHLIRDGRLISLNRFLSFEEMHAALSAMDLVCIPYPRHASISSILLRAAAARRPLLASDFGWIGYVTARFQLGTTCDLTRPDVFRETLRQALIAAPNYQWSPAAKQFSQFNSVENFAATWTQSLRSALGKPPSSALLPWESVEAATS
ncbi:MAG: glycosyltransferase family 4 protein [Planctomycetales bacterium]|nr:glycosyltransferase family 4 protein [Planctomycetales bacterium]